VPPIPGLNTRETALVAWLAVFLLWALAKREVRGSFGQVLKTILTSKWVGGVIGATAVYAVLTIVLLRYVGYWENEMAKTAALWFFGIAMVAIFRTNRTHARYFRRLVLDNLALAAVVEYVVNLHTFPLLVELVLVPLTFLLVGVQAVAEVYPQQAAARKPVVWLLSVLGLTAVSFSLVYLVRHFEEVATAEAIKDFLLPLILTVLFLPYLYVVRLIVVWQTMLHMIRFGFEGNRQLYWFTRRLVIRACGLSLRRAEFFEARFRGRLWGAANEEEVFRVVAQFRRVCHRIGKR
jgi:hypothetical protein